MGCLVLLIVWPALREAADCKFALFVVPDAVVVHSLPIAILASSKAPHPEYNNLPVLSEPYYFSIHKSTKK